MREGDGNHLQNNQTFARLHDFTKPQTSPLFD
jgi:hypothetical protein